MLKFIEGFPVVAKARPKDRRFSWVVLCVLPQPEEADEESDRFVVWNLDGQGSTSGCYYTKTLGSARAEFEGRI